MQQIKNYVNSAIESLQVAQAIDYIGEPVSQLEHALQCAYYAEQSGHHEDVIIASLFHDIGHFAASTPQIAMSDLGMIHHEWIGAKLVYEMGFSSRISLLIGHHVDAKRYLAARKKNYYEQLSEASKKTLMFQGGPMSDVEINAFEKSPHYKKILQVRINDEKGKKIGLQVPRIEYYRAIIEKHLLTSRKNYITLPNELSLVTLIDNKWVNKFKKWLYQRENIILSKQP